VTPCVLEHGNRLRSATSIKIRRLCSQLPLARTMDWTHCRSAGYGEEENLCLCWESNPVYSIVQPVTQPLWWLS